MKFIIRDYMGNPREIEITKEVESAYMTILTGDEILTVKYKDGTEEKFDSCDNRIADYYDDGYEVKLEDGKDFGTYDYVGDNVI